MALARVRVRSRSAADLGEAERFVICNGQGYWVNDITTWGEMQRW